MTLMKSRFKTQTISLVMGLMISFIPQLQAIPPIEESISAEKQKLYDLFEKKLSNVQFKGNFTILGKPQDNLPQESYTIKSVKKLPQGEYWLFTARIQFGKQDLTIPMPLEVKWAGTTPVITLTNVTIPGLGTFSSRVVI